MHHTKKTTCPVQVLFPIQLLVWSTDGLREPHKRKEEETVITNCPRMISYIAENVWFTSYSFKIEIEEERIRWNSLAYKDHHPHCQSVGISLKSP